MYVNEFQDYELALEEEDLRKIQARWRGAVVRNQLRKVREEYAKCFAEIEENPCCTICWQESLVQRPHFEPLARKNKQKDLLEDIRQLKISPDPSMGTVLNEMDKKDKYCDVAVGPDLDVHFPPQLFYADNVPCFEYDSQQDSVAETVNPPIGESNDELLLDLDESAASESSHQEEMRLDITEPLTARDEHLEDAAAEEMEERALTPVTPLGDEVPTRGPLDSQPPSIDVTLFGSNRQEQRHNLTLELLWVQQAIESRKQYLRLKQELTKRDEEW